jgi:hypothetical protein
MCKGSKNNLIESINIKIKLSATSKRVEQGLTKANALKNRPKTELSEKRTKGPIYTKHMCCQVTGLRSNVGRTFEHIKLQTWHYEISH